MKHLPSGLAPDVAQKGVVSILNCSIWHAKYRRTNSRKGSLLKSRLKMLGMAFKKLYQNTLSQFLYTSVMSDRGIATIYAHGHVRIFEIRQTENGKNYNKIRYKLKFL